MIRSLIALSLIVIGGSQAAQSTDARREYDAYLNTLRAAIMAGDADALGALVMEDRVSVSGANGKTVRGRAAQVQSDRVFFAASKITAFEMRVIDLRSSGSLAYATGIGTHTVTDRVTGQQHVDSFQYVDILIREADGHWRSRYFMNAPREP